MQPPLTRLLPGEAIACEPLGEGGALVTLATELGRDACDRVRAFCAKLDAHPPPGMIVDHINRNGLDNRRCNLRIGTIAQNAMNKRGQRNASSRFKGVTWSHHVSKWVASINEGGKRRHLGCFVSEIEAALAYDAAARILHGDWACLNFPDHDST